MEIWNKILNSLMMRNSHEVHPLLKISRCKVSASNSHDCHIFLFFMLFSFFNLQKVPQSREIMF